MARLSQKKSTSLEEENEVSIHLNSHFRKITEAEDDSSCGDGIVPMPTPHGEDILSPTLNEKTCTKFAYLR